MGEYLLFLVLAFFKLSALHLRWRYPVVQVHNLPDLLVFAALVPKLWGARLILDLHDLMPEFYAARYDTDIASWPVRIVRWQEALSCRFADHVITVTELWRLTLIQRGVPADKVSVVMNVADDSVFHRDDGAQMSETETGRFDLIYHGNFHQRYGLDLIIRAVDQVREQIPHIRLTLHGRGPYVESLRQLADELGLQEHVRFSTSMLPISELPSLIRQADVGVVPYRCDVFTDGILPTKLMEYAALGMPVIAARTSAIAHYFDNTMVEFFSPGDLDGLARCIRRLHVDQARRAQLAKGIVKFNERYSWVQLGQAYVELVARLGSH
jgi:glycosyltransferase involved in cell wall biosynthesis